MFDNVKKMTCLGVLERGARGDDNETGLDEGRGIEMSTTVLHGLKEGGGIEMSIYSAFHIRDARSPSLFVFYLPLFVTIEGVIKI